MNNTIKTGDTFVIPEKYNNGIKSVGVVKQVFKRFVLLEDEKGRKITVQIGDIPKLKGYIKGISEENNEMEKDILNSII